MSDVSMLEPEETFYTGEAFGPPPPFSATECIAEYADGVLIDLLKWTEWHAARAKARKLPKPWGMAAVDIAASDLFEAIWIGCNDDALDDAGNRLHGAVTRAKSEAYRICRRYGGNTIQARNADEQAEELETSYLRGYAHTLCAMAYYFRMARCRSEEARKWCHEAAEELAFHMPPKIEIVTGIIENISALV